MVEQIFVMVVVSSSLRHFSVSEMAAALLLIVFAPLVGCPWIQLVSLQALLIHMAYIEWLWEEGLVSRSVLFLYDEFIHRLSFIYV